MAPLPGYMEGEIVKDELLATLIGLAESEVASGTAAKDAPTDMLIRLLFDAVASGSLVKAAAMACILESRNVPASRVAACMESLYAQSVHREGVRIKGSKQWLLALCDNYLLTPQGRLNEIRRELMR